MTDKQETRKWYHDVGVFELNKAVTTYSGEGLGDIPLGNIFKLPGEIDQSVLLDELRNDGAKAHLDEDGDIVIYIR